MQAWQNTNSGLILVPFYSRAAKCYWRKMLNCAICHYKFLLCNHSWIPNTILVVSLVSSHAILYSGYFRFLLSTLLRYLDHHMLSLSRPPFFLTEKIAYLHSSFPPITMEEIFLLLSLVYPSLDPTVLFPQKLSSLLCLKPLSVGSFSLAFKHNQFS